MRAVLLLFISTLIFGCRQEYQTEKIIFKVEDNFQSKNKVDAHQMIFARNAVHMYGKLGIGNSLGFKDSLNHWGRDPKLTNQYMKFDLVVDTVNTLPLELYLDNLGLPEEIVDFKIDSIHKINKYDYVAFESMPVYIINRDTVDHVLKFQDGSVFMIYEALDSLGNWKPIEYWNIAVFCGNSYYEKVIKPDFYLVSKVLKYEGDYQTKLRLKFRNFDEVAYSESFSGTINYSQFDDSSIVAYSNAYATLWHEENPDSIRYIANDLLAETRLDR